MPETRMEGLRTGKNLPVKTPSIFTPCLLSAPMPVQGQELGAMAVHLLLKPALPAAQNCMLAGL